METQSSPLTCHVGATVRLDPINWAYACGIRLRPYQCGVVLAIKESILRHLGLTFVVIFPRQSGKNELQAHLFAWLLFRYALAGGRIVSVSPTFKPQTTNNMQRVGQSLDHCIVSRGRWRRSKGYMLTLGDACLQFFSGAPSSRVVGATADLLLSVDEAQDIDPVKFDKDFDPMTASTNATRVFWGTAWTAHTLLERQRRIALQAQARDGIQRVFVYTAEDVCHLVPAYGVYLDRVISELGRNHPLVRTQFFCETIDAQSGMFTPSRMALLFARSQPQAAERHPADMGSQGASEQPQAAERHPADMGSQGASEQPQASTLSSAGMPSQGAGSALPYSVPGLLSSDSPLPTAFLIDVAGMDESNTSLASSLHSQGLGNPGRDSTTLTVVGLDLSTLPTLHHPAYCVLARHSWTGENHLAVFAKLKNLAEKWSPQHIVIDATGVGEGLWSLLDHAFPTRVLPVKFTAQEKSEIGWRFLYIIETGRFTDPAPSDQVRLQYSRCVSEILPGPAKHLRWGVPEGLRGPDGELIHDDYLLADSLTAVLDRLEWTIHTEPWVSEGFDPLEGIFGYESPDRSWVSRSWPPSSRSPY